MTPPCPYGPDRSLPIAIALLVGGGLFATAALYLLTTSTETLTGPYQARMTEAQMQRQARSAARRSRGFTPAARRTMSGRHLGNAPYATSPPGRVPAWAGSGTSPSPRTPAQGLYDLRPDMSHAELGPPPNGQGLGLAGAGASRGDGSSPARGLPEAGRDPLTADLGSGASGQSTSWRSNVSKLGDQARALSGALSHLDRSGRSAGGDPGTGGPSGNASTASAGGDTYASGGDPPNTPGDPPQVPVDGGLGWLAAAGAAYAANRLRKHQEDELDDAA